LKLLIKNGSVYDPINSLKGDRMDIAVNEGKIVDQVREEEAEVVDASGMVVMPGGVDIHSHIAGPDVNLGRLLRPEDHYRDVVTKTRLTRSGVGHSVPSTFVTGYRYSTMGYTMVVTPSMPPLEARHTHEELNDTPMIDKAAFPLLGDWWFVLEYLRDKKFEECAAHVAWMMRATKGYAIKIVNPGGLERWGFGGNVHTIRDEVPGFNITPREIIRGLCKVNSLLNLPHTIHLHTNNLGKPGNYSTTLDTLKCLRNLATGDKPVVHITHCQFSSFTGSDWLNMGTGADIIARYLNQHTHATIDMGQVLFGDTTTMTADGPFQYDLYTLTGNKWMNHDVETETSGGVVPFRYKRTSPVHAMQWSIGLELALLIDDPWKVYMTTDHPNAGPFTGYPRIIAWLMSRSAREKTMSKIHRKARRKSLLPSIDREYGFYEIAIATRAGQARALGLRDKGHLGIGADADIAIYDVDPEKIDPSRDYRKVRRAFRNAAYTIKDGNIVVKGGEIVQSRQGRTFWVDPAVSPEWSGTNDDMRNRFKDYWTIEFENYPIRENFLERSEPIRVETEV
jgi:formylmethanofuran dehydrogenase subunit A